MLLDSDGVLLGRNFSPSQLVAVPTPKHIVPTEEMLTMEKIVNHRKRGRGYQYLVKWKGFDVAHNTWEPADNFFDISVISDYWKGRDRIGV